MSGGSTIGAEQLSSGLSVLGYQYVVGQLPLFNPQADSALLVGLGPGHLVNTYAEFGISTDSMEIDPVVADLPTRYFNFTPTGDVIVGDARCQITHLTKTYDLIIHGCFTGGAEPIHLLSVEMFQKLKERLNPGGILALNFVGLTTEGDQAPVEAVAKKLDQVCPYRGTFGFDTSTTFESSVCFFSCRSVVISASLSYRNQVRWLES